jgi:hypothetical protein
VARINPIQVQKYLGGVDYPVSKDELVRRAQEKGADDQVLQALKHLPQERFNGPNDVSQAMGKAA